MEGQYSLPCLLTLPSLTVPTILSFSPIAAGIIRETRTPFKESPSNKTARNASPVLEEPSILTTVDRISRDAFSKATMQNSLEAPLLLPAHRPRSRYPTLLLQ